MYALRIIVLAILTVVSFGKAKAQDSLYFTDSSVKSMWIPFKMSQNLIVLTLSINDSQSMNFVLDSGLTNTIITEMTGVDSVSLHDTREIKLAGLGSGEPVKAILADGNKIFLSDPQNPTNGILGSNVEIIILPDDHFSLSKQLGIQINGLVGSDFFSAFVIDIDYRSKSIQFIKKEAFNPEHRKYRRFQKLPLETFGAKSFVTGVIHQQDRAPMEVQLMIDTGASLPMWLAAHTNSDIHIPDKTVPALLGQGLSGEIAGVNARIPGLEFGGHFFKNPIVSYPDSSSVLGLLKNSKRNGSLGNDVLRRFHLVFDYSRNLLLIKSNGDVNDPFTYNRSGMEVEKPFLDLPYYTIFNIVEGSPAAIAGVKIGDEVQSINYQRTTASSLDQINSILHGHHGKTVHLRLVRNGESLKVHFRLSEDI